MLTGPKFKSSEMQILAFANFKNLQTSTKGRRVSYLQKESLYSLTIPEMPSAQPLSLTQKFHPSKAPRQDHLFAVWFALLVRSCFPYRASEWVQPANKKPVLYLVTRNSKDILEKIAIACVIDTRLSFVISSFFRKCNSNLFWMSLCHCHTVVPESRLYEYDLDALHLKPQKQSLLLSAERRP